MNGHEASYFLIFNKYKMISQRELETRYNKLIEDVKTKEFYKVDLTNRVNCYTCDCLHITKTKDIDAGVTPFFHTCEKCGKMAKSSFFNDIIPPKKPTQEWYRPTLDECMKLRNKNPAYLDHILNGGLVSRKIQNS